MKKSIFNLGKLLSKDEQRNIQGQGGPCYLQGLSTCEEIMTYCPSLYYFCDDGASNGQVDPNARKK